MSRKRNQLDTPAINWFCQQFKQSQFEKENEKIDDLAFHTGWSKQNVKRALAEGGLLYLTWHKTSEEDAMLKFLRQKNITTFAQLRNAFL